MLFLAETRVLGALRDRSRSPFAFAEVAGGHGELLDKPFEARAKGDPSTEVSTTVALVGGCRGSGD